MYKELLGVNGFISKKGEPGLMLHTAQDMSSGDDTRLGQSVKVLFVNMKNFKNVFGCEPESYDFKSRIGELLNFSFNDSGFLETVADN